MFTYIFTTIAHLLLTTHNSETFCYICRPLIISLTAFLYHYDSKPSLYSLLTSIYPVLMHSLLSQLVYSLHLGISSHFHAESVTVVNRISSSNIYNFLYLYNCVYHSSLTSDQPPPPPPPPFFFPTPSPRPVPAVGQTKKTEEPTRRADPVRLPDSFSRSDSDLGL